MSRPEFEIKSTGIQEIPPARVLFDFLRSKEKPGYHYPWQWDVAGIAGQTLPGNRYHVPWGISHWRVGYRWKPLRREVRQLLKDYLDGNRCAEIEEIVKRESRRESFPGSIAVGEKPTEQFVCRGRVKTNLGDRILITRFDGDFTPRQLIFTVFRESFETGDFRKLWFCKQCGKVNYSPTQTGDFCPGDHCRDKFRRPMRRGPLKVATEGYREEKRKAIEEKLAREFYQELQNSKKGDSRVSELLLYLVDPRSQLRSAIKAGQPWPSWDSLTTDDKSFVTRLSQVYPISPAS